LMIAFSIYSRIPMPAFLWEEKDRKRAMYFFPLVGAVVGVLFYGAFWFLEYKGAGTVFSAAVLTAIPFFVTGGIHMDGFLDTCDARASFGDREKKLEILKDPHTGAFGVILGILYVLFYFSACTELTEPMAGAAAAGFILSRALSGFGAAAFPEARAHGMLSDFMKDVHKKQVAVVMAVFGAFAACLMVWLGGRYGLLAVISSAAVFFYYRRMVFFEFGGVTGDLAGYFLQLCELFLVLSMVIGGYFL